MVRIAAGDRTAYKILVDRHLATFLIFSSRVIADRAEAEDVMQEAFVRVWKNAAKWDKKRGVRFTTWFYRIVLNLCIDVKRRRKPGSDLSEAYDVTSDGPEPDDMLEEKQRAAAISRALEQLPQRQRVAITLCYLQEMGNRQAAEVMNISVGAIESLLVRGRAKMAELLETQQDSLL